MNDVLVRSYPAELVEDNDGRTLHGRVVPYDVPARVSDGGPAYDEVFAKGAFRRACKAPARVYLQFEHHPGLSNVAGYGTELAEQDDGLYGSFRTLEDQNGQRALELHRAGVLSYFSVGFVPIGHGRKMNGATVRTHCHLDEVSLCRKPAYPGTEAAVRSAAAALLEVPVRDEAFEARLQAVLRFTRT